MEPSTFRISSKEPLPPNTSPGDALSGPENPAASTELEPSWNHEGEGQDTGGAKDGASSWRPIARELVETVVLTLVIFFLIRTVVQNFRVDGMSMEPNFQDGQFLLINKLSYRLGDPQRGDVIVFHYPRDPSRDFIKRVIGLPGETVEIVDGQVFIDGEHLPDLTDIIPASYTAAPITVNADELFVMGDNRPNSSDSHSWGTLPMNLVVGKVLLSYWPPNTWGIIRTPDGAQTAASEVQQ